VGRSDVDEEEQRRHPGSYFGGQAAPTLKQVNEVRRRDRVGARLRGHRTFSLQRLLDDRPDQCGLAGEPSVHRLDGDTTGAGDARNRRRGIPLRQELHLGRLEQGLSQLFGTGASRLSVVAPLDLRHASSHTQ
jgi:hypothetical protein